MGDRLAEIEARLDRLYRDMPLALTTDLRDLLAVANAAREFIEEYRAMNGGEGPTDPVTRRLDAALTNLEPSPLTTPAWYRLTAPRSSDTLGSFPPCAP